MAKAALSIETEYRSGLERRVAAQLEKEGVTFEYETLKVHFEIPARKARYTPDFPCAGDIVLETKGYFRTAADRQRLILVKECNPDLDLRLVFQDANKPIYKGSPTSYAKWATDHGFKWADKGIVPAAWITEMKRKRKK
jgi:hypothetical protein